LNGSAEQIAAADRAAITAFRDITLSPAARLLSYGVRLQNMPQHCTILCPTDDAKRVVDLLRDAVGERGTVCVVGQPIMWSSITVVSSAASLVLNRLVRVRPGDEFSKLVLSMHNYFRRVTTSHAAIQADVLQRITGMGLVIGVVAEPEFVDSAGHYDCIFGLAEALGALVWTGSGVLNAQGELLLDGDGNSEVVK
jgi:hypothetical protein